MPISNTLLPRIATSAIATILIGFGINAMTNYESALSMFELQYPTSAQQRSLVDALLVIYGIRDVFMGVAIFATVCFGSNRALGWILLMGGGVAGVDEWVCKTMVGKGEMVHWGYAPVLLVLGMVYAGGL